MGKKDLAALLTALLVPAGAPAQCPTKEEASLIITRVVKTPTAVVDVRPTPGFCGCEAKTESGESYFISKDRKWVIEGILVKVPRVELSREEYERLLRRALFSIGKGEPLLVLTNPLCRACSENRDKLLELSRRFKLYFIPVGFEGEEFKAAVDAYCTGRSWENFFTVEGELKECDAGKLKVWSVADILRRHGITATPVFVLPNGLVAVGVEELLREVKTEGGAS